MTREIDFYFDFASPYGYIASAKIDHVAAKASRTVRWRPFLIGVVYKTMGGHSPLDQPAKVDYLRRDVPRSAAYYGVPLSFPAGFPEALIAPARAVWWLDDRDPALAGAFAKAAYRAYWAEGRRIGEPEVVAAIGADLGIPAEETLAALADPAVKDRLRRETDEAIARGVFGSPFIVIDGEPFWGSDRLAQVEAWLESGGWPK